MMKPEAFLKQARLKYRLNFQRQMREMQRGERQVLEGNLTERATLDAIKRAYAAGLRDGLSKVMTP